MIEKGNFFLFSSLFFLDCCSLILSCTDDDHHRLFRKKIILKHLPIFKKKKTLEAKINQENFSQKWWSRPRLKNGKILLKTTNRRLFIAHQKWKRVDLLSVDNFVIIFDGDNLIDYNYKKKKKSKSKRGERTLWPERFLPNRQNQSPKFAR